MIEAKNASETSMLFRTDVDISGPIGICYTHLGNLLL
jgi:hypothetical protein